MLSYRHAFHAGNHADVLKHLTLFLTLSYLQQKPTPLQIIDTHAGRGLYRLSTPEALKKAEFADGIGRLWRLREAKAPMPEGIEPWLDALGAFQAKAALSVYPGSPAQIKSRLRPEDKFIAIERHPNEIKNLRECLGRPGRSNRQIRVIEGDGFAALKGLLPPPSRRGLTLIDPPYERGEEYRAAADAAEDAIKRFPTGVLLLWYPRIARLESRDLERRLKKRLTAPWLAATLDVAPPPKDGYGLYGSGLFVVNPPWMLEAQLRQALPFLAQTLQLSADAPARTPFSLECSPAA
ncbi:MAG: 23S rRNA (adenine(2030)-N(6))-methyltransferase RlmJ [Zoogloeaceae bacterium]|jgi:23S rRNA (adenine2030-N6)-methyltransferase|nr:23S rRNA (adenine(2030)-N(6))-methyltransferase RlmJ [Zoogloeaceae bacterium]